MSVTSWRWTSLRLPRNPRIAARVLLKRANLSFVLTYVMTDAYGSLCFSAIFSSSLLITLLHSGAILPVVVKASGFIEWGLFYVNHSLVVFIFLLLFMLLIDHCQGFPPSLFHGHFRLDSAIGVQQGDPLGPALFALAIHRVTSEVKSDLNAWYLDDGCIGGDPQTVPRNAAIIRNGLSSVGLEINNSKCELLIAETIQLFQEEFPSISIPAPYLWQLLGSLCIRIPRHYI